MRIRNFFGVLRAVLFCAVILLITSPSEGVDMQEGEWEFTSEIVAEGMPFTMPPTKTRQCLSKKDLVPKSEDDKNCVVKNHQISGNTVRWTILCKDNDGTSEGKGVITYSGRSYKGTMKMTMTDKTGATERMTMNMSGKYLGPCSKETIAAQRETERQISDAIKKRDQALKELENETAKRKKEADAIISRVKVPNEDRDACVFDTESPKKNTACDNSFGVLDIKDGWWEVKKEVAMVMVLGDKRFDYSTLPEEKKEIFLTQNRPLGMDRIHIGNGCGGENIVVKRSGNKLTWSHRCDYQSSGRERNTLELKGGIIFSGGSYDGGIIEKLYTNGKETSTTYKKLTGTYSRGRSYSAKKREYTSSDRQESSPDEPKDSSNPLKSIKKLFGW